MQSVDLSWLKYVAYLFWAATFLSYMVARLKTRRIVKGLWGALTGVAVFLAIFTLSFTENHQQQYSPRVLVVGNVVQIIEETHKGSYDDELVLRLPDQSTTPLLETGYLGQTTDLRHFLRGDQLEIEYRAWDNKVLHLIVLQGKHARWTYASGFAGWGVVYVGLLPLLFGFGYALWQWSRHRDGDTEAPSQQRHYPPEITTLGLGAEDHAE